ncbi:MAG: hypothetical protein U0U69_15130 [Acidimicrobiia bacterium]
MRTPRGAVTAVVLVLVVAGTAALTSMLGQGGGSPRLGFADARGSADDVRAKVAASTRDGELSESLAPGRGAGAAERLDGAAAIFLSVAADPDAEVPVEATERVVVTNTSAVDLDDVRLHVLAPAVGATLRVLAAKVGGVGVDARMEGTTMVLGLRDALAPGESTVVDLSWDLAPVRVTEAENPNPAEVLKPGGGKSRFDAQLVRRNLLYLFDWYPRPEPLDAGGWRPLQVDPAIADTHGPATSVELEVTRTPDWHVVAGGTRVRDDAGDAHASSRFVLAGSRVMPLVLQRNAVERTVSKGVYRGIGFGLDTFGPAVEDSAGQALAAKAVMSEATGSPFWRDVVVVGLVFGGDATSFVADNVVFVRQDVLARGVPGLGPGTQPSDYRQAAFEGSTAEWWGGVVDVDATAAPALRTGVRQSAAAVVWRGVGGDAIGRVATADVARRYRVARAAGTPDMAADLDVSAYTTAATRDIAVSKAALVYQALGVAVTGDSPAAWDGTLDVFGSLADAASLDPGSVAAAATGAGVDRGRADALVGSWLRGTDGDATIGRADGLGTIVYFTDGAAADAAAGASPTVPLDLDAVKGAGPGW